MQMIICHPLDSGYLCQDPDSISWTFLEQFVLVIFCPFKEGANSGPCLGIRGQDLTPCFACVSTSSSGKGTRLPYPFGLLRKSLVEVLRGSTTSLHFLIRRLLPIFQLLIQTMRQSHFLRRLVLIKNFSILHQPPHQLAILISNNRTRGQ